MEVLVIDNFDSFTFNLVHIVEQIVPSVVVKRNNEVEQEDVEKAQAIIISPGPGLPNDAGITCQIIEQYCSRKPILGICLGMQAIGEVFGARLKNLPKVYHGKKRPIDIIDHEEILFKGIPKQINVGRYHSWVVENSGLPKCLKVTALDKDGEIMALSHRNHNVRGVQFHPESIMTEFGKEMIFNWLYSLVFFK